MRQLKTALAVIGAAVILVLAGNTVVTAATGQNFILGKTNFASAPTTIERTNAGSPFKITADSTSTSSAPFSTNATGKVTNLNADKVDGFDSSTLRTTAYKYTTAINASTTQAIMTVPVPTGSYVVSYSAYLNGSDGGDEVFCYLEQDALVGSSTYVGESRFTSGVDTPGLTGTGLLSKNAGNSLELHCGATTAFTTTSLQPIQIVAVRVDSLAANGSITPARVAPSEARKN